MHQEIIRALRNNSRAKIKHLSSNLNIPLSTCLKYFKQVEKNFVKKYVSLVDFTKINFPIRLGVYLKSDEDSVKNFLMSHENVNNIFWISPSYNLYADLVFRNIKETEEFLAKLKKFKANKKIIYLFNPLKEEEFFSET